MYWYALVQHYMQEGHGIIVSVPSFDMVHMESTPEVCMPSNIKFWGNFE